MSKLPHVGTTIFTVMSKMAAENNAINLSQGFPNFPVDAQLTSILADLANQPIHQYAPMAGNQLLLENIQSLILKTYGRAVNVADEVLVTAGATQAIYTAITAFVEPGDEVIMIDPSYDCYEPPVLLAGGKSIRISANKDFSIDWNKIEDQLTDKTKLLIINNPHNPSGKILDTNDLENIESLMNRFPKLLLLSDEVYEFITFDRQHISVNLRQQLFHRSIIVSSFGKTFHITGWKIGYMIAPPKLMIEMKKVHQFLVFSVNSVGQQALAKYLALKDTATLGSFYKEKRDFFAGLMKDSRFNLLPSEGSYFQVADYSSISMEKDTEFCKRLVTEHGVAAIPLSVFYADGTDRKMIRFCFAKDEDTLTKAAEKLCKI